MTGTTEGWLKVGREPCLSLEAHAARVPRKLATHQNLDGDVAAERLLPCAVHNRTGPAANLSHEGELAELHSGGKHLPIGHRLKEPSRRRRAVLQQALYLC